MKKLYSMSEIYKATYDLARIIGHLRKAKKQKLLSPMFTERIMLAVTEVNNCEMCSYAHTKMALESGLSKKEINNLLGGETSDVPSHEIMAILFAQHYADVRTKPSEEAWNTLVNTYGGAKAKGILGTVRMITLGNIMGIPFGSLTNRFKRKKSDPRSSVGYELSVIFMMIFVSPIALIHGLIATLSKKSII